ncbi:MAG TPA: EAL domain-containing protein [Jiangellales bacterium]|nr:EAL domain-containing protein [Jiangellales bacterium]
MTDTLRESRDDTLRESRDDTLRESRRTDVDGVLEKTTTAGASTTGAASTTSAPTAAATARATARATVRAGPWVLAALAWGGVTWLVPDPWSWVLAAAAAAVAAASFWWASGSARTQLRRGWRLAAVWALVTALAKLVEALEYGWPPAEPLVLAVRVAGLVLLVVVLHALLRATYLRGALPRTFLDGWLYVGSVLAVATAVLGVPDMPRPVLLRPDTLVTLAYVAVDLCLLAVLIGLLLRGRGRSRQRTAIGIAAVAAIALSDLAQLEIELRVLEDARVPSAAAAAGFVLLAVLPWSGRDPGPVGVFPQRTSLAAVAGPYAVASLAALALGAAAFAGEVLGVTTLVLAGSVVLALLARQYLTLVDNVQLVEELAAREDHFRSIVLSSSDVILVTDGRGTVRYVSPSVGRVLGYVSGDVVGTPLSELVHPDDVDAVAEQVAELLASGDHDTRVDARVRAADGGWRHMESTVSRDSRGLIVHARDVSDRVALREQLAHLAYHDALTGLPNRALFTARVEASLRRRSVHGEQVGVVFLDLDGFKNINDSSGHEAGDEVLVEAARRLTEAVGPGDTVARFGGDEFAVLVERRITRGDVLDVARRVSSALRSPFDLAGRATTVSASVGVAFADDAEEVTGLLRGADLAMYRAKAAGSGRVEAYRPELLVNAQQQAELSARLLRALEERAFALLYQPVVDLATERVVGVEALIRWRTETGVLMTPAELVRTAETSGRIEALGQWVVEEALAQAARWRSSGHRLDLAVNLSTAQVANPGLLDVVDHALRVSGVPAYTLTLELTESVLLEEESEAVARLHELKGLGLRLALDDFGTGYSSLSYLQRLPVDVIKVDRSFVAGLGADGQSETVLGAVVRLARQLGLTVTAEGVETPAQARSLLALGCHRAQGFHFSGPVDAEGVADLVARGPLPSATLPTIRTAVSRDETVPTDA